VGGARGCGSESIHRVSIEGTFVDALLDTGSPFSFIDINYFNKHFSSELQYSSNSFLSVSGEKFTAIGECNLSVCIDNFVKPIRFFVINSPMHVILGINALKEMNVTISFSKNFTKIGTLSSCNHVVDDKNIILEKISLPNDITRDSFVQTKNLLMEYKDIFSNGDYDIGRTSIVQHEIDTGNSKPIFSKQYRIPHFQKDNIDKMIQEMLKNDIIEPCNSPWSSPVLLVPKKNGKSRFVVDFRKLNDITVKDRMPIPNIEELFDNLSGKEVFTSLDFTAGYWQIPLSNNAKPKTAFLINNNQYQFKVMPFGLVNAPATFQRMMMNLTSDLDSVPYLDDIILSSKSEVENIKVLRCIFEKLRKANFKLKASKCSLLQRKVKYLGFVIKKTKSDLIRRKSKQFVIGNSQSPHRNCVDSWGSVTTFRGLLKIMQKLQEI